MTAKLVPELCCTDYERSLAFYTDILGFEILYTRVDEGFAYLTREGVELMIDMIGKTRTWLAGPLEHPYGRGVNLQIETSDVEKLYSDVQKAGAEIFCPLEIKWYRNGSTEKGNKQFIVLDPDGYMLRFFENMGVRDAA